MKRLMSHPWTPCLVTALALSCLSDAHALAKEKGSFAKESRAEPAAPSAPALSPPCVEDAECSDGDVCTDDTCEHGSCVYTAVPMGSDEGACCHTNLGCDNGKACDEDLCVANRCTHPDTSAQCGPSDLCVSRWCQPEAAAGAPAGCNAMYVGAGTPECSPVRHPWGAMGGRGGGAGPGGIPGGAPGPWAFPPCSDAQGITADVTGDGQLGPEDELGEEAMPGVWLRYDDDDDDGDGAPDATISTLPVLSPAEVALHDDLRRLRVPAVPNAGWQRKLDWGWMSDHIVVYALQPDGSAALLPPDRVLALNPPMWEPTEPVELLVQNSGYWGANFTAPEDFAQVVFYELVQLNQGGASGCWDAVMFSNRSVDLAIDSDNNNRVAGVEWLPNTSLAEQVIEDEPWGKLIGYLGDGSGWSPYTEVHELTLRDEGVFRYADPALHFSDFRPGDTLRFSNWVASPAQAVMVSADDGTWEIGPIGPGESQSLSFPLPWAGTYTVTGEGEGLMPLRGSLAPQTLAPVIATVRDTEASVRLVYDPAQVEVRDMAREVVPPETWRPWSEVPEGALALGELRRAFGVRGLTRSLVPGEVTLSLEVDVDGDGVSDAFDSVLSTVADIDMLLYGFWSEQRQISADDPQAFIAAFVSVDDGVAPPDEAAGDDAVDAAMDWDHKATLSHALVRGGDVYALTPLEGAAPPATSVEVSATGAAPLTLLAPVEAGREAEVLSTLTELALEPGDDAPLYPWTNAPLQRLQSFVTRPGSLRFTALEHESAAVPPGGVATHGATVMVGDAHGNPAPDGTAVHVDMVTRGALADDMHLVIDGGIDLALMPDAWHGNAGDTEVAVHLEVDGEALITSRPLREVEGTLSAPGTVARGEVVLAEAFFADDTGAPILGPVVLNCFNCRFVGGGQVLETELIDGWVSAEVEVGTLSHGLGLLVAGAANTNLFHSFEIGGPLPHISPEDGLIGRSDGPSWVELEELGPREVSNATTVHVRGLPNELVTIRAKVSKEALNLPLTVVIGDQTPNVVGPVNGQLIGAPERVDDLQAFGDSALAFSLGDALVVESHPAIALADLALSTAFTHEAPVRGTLISKPGEYLIESHVDASFSASVFASGQWHSLSTGPLFMPGEWSEVELKIVGNVVTFTVNQVPHEMLLPSALVPQGEDLRVGGDLVGRIGHLRLVALSSEGPSEVSLAGLGAGDTLQLDGQGTGSFVLLSSAVSGAAPSQVTATELVVESASGSAQSAVLSADPVTVAWYEELLRSAFLGAYWDDGISLFEACGEGLMIALGTDDVRDAVVNFGRLINSYLPMVDGAREPEYIDMSIALVALGLRFSMAHTGGGGLAGGISLTLIKRTLKAIPPGPARTVLKRRVRQELSAQGKVSAELNALFTQLDNTPWIINRLFPTPPPPGPELRKFRMAALNSDRRVQQLVSFAAKDQNALKNLGIAVFSKGLETDPDQLRQARWVMARVAEMPNPDLAIKLAGSVKLLQGLKAVHDLEFTPAQIAKLGGDYPEFATYPPEAFLEKLSGIDGWVHGRFPVPDEYYEVRSRVRLPSMDIGKIFDLLGTPTWGGPTPWGLLNETVNILVTEFDYTRIWVNYRVEFTWKEWAFDQVRPASAQILAELDDTRRSFVTWGRVAAPAPGPVPGGILYPQDFVNVIEADMRLTRERQLGLEVQELSRFFVPQEGLLELDNYAPAGLTSFFRALPPIND
ncbi:MAG: hypothetical protein ACPGU1_17900 [Myxococcota bacterium]